MTEQNKLEKAGVLSDAIARRRAALQASATETAATQDGLPRSNLAVVELVTQFALDPQQLSEAETQEVLALIESDAELAAQVADLKKHGAFIKRKHQLVD